MARRAIHDGKLSKKVVGVSRFFDQSLKHELENDGIETIACDLFDDEALHRLPDIKNVIFMVGNKF